MEPLTVLRDHEDLEVINGNQRWLTRWHPAGEAPVGRPHGSAGICVTDTDEVILISTDAQAWYFPAGRPEGNESWEETLRREMMEEACASVQHARLLGFSQGTCIEGPEQGLVLVRAIWLARVRLLEWKPEFEISHRKVVPANQALAQLTPVPPYHPFWRRAFVEANLA